MSGHDRGGIVPSARRYWVALLLCGVLLCLSLPFYLTTGYRCYPGDVSQLDGMPMCAVAVSSPQGVLSPQALAHPSWLPYYWLLGLVAGVVVLAWWYARSGAVLRVLLPLLVAVGTAATTVLLTRAQWSGVHSPSAWAAAACLLLFNGASPLVVMVPMLLVLAVAERSPGLALFGLGFGGLCYLFATHDSLDLFHQAGMPLDRLDDPAGIRQLLNMAVPAVALLLAARLAYLTGNRGPAEEEPRAALSPPRTRP
ncbi:hypothetical protein ACFW1A_31785 [Kitasatospora sp. NPDC058965]|uniref:hypothetical protein n=1 Tax=Kitasatospora sp. NPDC058965 TaxID=3346682 RepID=UPI0036A3B7F9